MTESRSSSPRASRPPRHAEGPALPVASLLAVPVRQARAPGPAPAPAPLPPREAPKQAPLPERTQTAPPREAAPVALPAAGDPAALIAWWNRLKRGAASPSPADLDATAIGAAWPDAVLLAYDKARQDIARASRLGNADSLAIEYTPMMTEWLLALGRKAAREGAPLHETRNFADARGLTAYRLTALPLSADRGSPDHVLCQLARA